MNAFYEHHKNSIEFGYRCFDRLLLNGLIQPFQQPERVLGFFNTYRDGKRVTRHTLTEIADQFHHWVTNRSEKWGAPIVEAPQHERRDDFVHAVLAEDRSRSCGRHSEGSRTRPHPGRNWRKAEQQPSPRTEAALGESIQFLSQRPTMGAHVCPHVSLLSFLRPSMPESASLAGSSDATARHRLSAMQERLLALLRPATIATARRLSDRPRFIALWAEVADRLYSLLHLPGTTTG